MQLHSVVMNGTLIPYVSARKPRLITRPFVLTKCPCVHAHLLPAYDQVVLKRAHNAAELQDNVNNKMIEFANRGFRSLGIAMAEGDGKTARI